MADPFPSSLVGVVAPTDELLKDPWGRLPGDAEYFIAPVDTGPVKPPFVPVVTSVVNPDGTTTTTTTNEDGTVSSVTTGTPTGGGNDAPAGDQVDARNTIKRVLDTFGLGSLSDFVYGGYAKKEFRVDNTDALLFYIREQDAYKERFAANAQRKAKGLSELDPASYIGLENQYEQIMRAYNMPAGFFDQKSDFTGLIAENKSPSEVNDAIALGFARIDQATPEARQKFQEYYPEAGFTRESLAAWFIDPSKAALILERQANAALIGARAKEQGGMMLGRLTAEELVARGYTNEEANRAFMDYSSNAGLYNEMLGEQVLTEAQKVGAAFGFDPAGTKALKLRKDVRTGEFAGGGQFSRSRGVTSGTQESGVGEAQ